MLHQDGDASVLLLERLSDEAKEHIRHELAAFCFGTVTVAEDAAYYSFERTIAEFFTRFDSKTPETQLGMAGELAVHTMMAHSYPDLTSSAVFFNKEERSIRKGFDLLFHGPDMSLWYGEVKSGNVLDPAHPNSDSASLIKLAAKDLAGKLGDKANRTHWDSAVIDAAATLRSDDASTVKRLLRTDAQTIENEGLSCRHGLLASVAIHDIQCHRLEMPGVLDPLGSIAQDHDFDAVKLILIQQSAMDDIVSFLRAEAA